MMDLGHTSNEPRRRLCSHCGTPMEGYSSGDENVWECPQCHSLIQEHVVGAGSPVMFSSSIETGPQDLITDEQAQLLTDIGETSIPSFKHEASLLINDLTGCFDSWLVACFRKRDVLQPQDHRRLQIAMHKAGLRTQYPKYGKDLTEAQRVEIMRFVKEALGRTVSRNGPS